MEVVVVGLKPITRGEGREMERRMSGSFFASASADRRPCVRRPGLERRERSYKFSS